ncbi:hypothetical protein JCM5350_000524 [Sporobolomyces pararoseus]
MSSTGDTITLSTSDDPPVLIKVPRSALVANSKVFADMLSLPVKSDNQDESIPISENESEIKVFLSMLESNESQENLAALTEAQWRMIAKLSDKYDSWSVRKAVEAKAWQVEAEGGSAAFAFALATLTGNQELIKHTAKRVVLIPDLRSSRLHVTQEWKDRLAAWRTVQASNCLRQLQALSNKPQCSRDYDSMRKLLRYKAN